MDEYADDPGRLAKDTHTFGYEQVQLYARITLPSHPGLRITRDKTEALAIMSLCRTNGEDATRGPVWYRGGNV